MRTIVLTVCLLTGSAAALAQDGDAAAGATKAATCTACHGLNGNSANPEWPVLAGQNANYLSDQITRFREGKRTNALMQPMVAPLTDQDIADLAAYFSQQTPTGNEADPLVLEGWRKAVPRWRCQAWHSRLPGLPRPRGKRQSGRGLPRPSHAARCLHHQAAQ